MAENKTKQTEIAVDDFLGTKVADEKTRSDCYMLIDMMQRVTGYPAKMWGPSIVGFDSYHYQYESGREGYICAIGFSPRAANLTLYVHAGIPEIAALFDKLGKHKTGKGCLYIKKLSDVDMGVLEDITRTSYHLIKQKHPA